MEALRVYCFGCGDDITGSSSNRLRMSGSVCSRAIPIWKKKLSEVLKSQDSNIIDVDELMKMPEVIDGKMCRPCVSVLERLDKLEKNVTIKITTFVESVIPTFLSKQRREDDDYSADYDQSSSSRAMPSTSSLARTDMRWPINTIPSNSRSTSSVVFASLKY